MWTRVKDVTHMGRSATGVTTVHTDIIVLERTMISFTDVVVIEAFI